MTEPLLAATSMPTPADIGEPNTAAWVKMVKGSSTAREAIFLFYLPYAKAVAASIFSRRYSKDVAIEDYHQLAYVGLLDAMQRFDPARGIPFKAFCTPRITGSVLDGVRRLSDVQEQISLKRRLQQERLASLKTADIDPKPANVLADLAVGLAIGHMLEGTGMYATGQETMRHDSYEAAAWSQTCRLLRDAVRMLPDNMARVIELHYFHAIAFEQIAEILDLSKGRISQIHRTGLSRLRESIRHQHETWIRR